MERTLSAMASDFINACRNADPDEFLKQMSRLHRTDQQSFVGLIFRWLNDYAGYMTDDRNKASVEFVSDLRELYCQATGREYFKDLFPFI